MEQLTREQAIAFNEGGVWRRFSARELALFQLEQERLCVDLNVFHKAVEEAAGRKVFTHELARNRDGLVAELLGDKPAPSFAEVLALLPRPSVVLVRG